MIDTERKQFPLQKYTMCITTNDRAHVSTRENNIAYPQ